KINPVLLGINNRDLRTFQVDLETSFRLKKKIPAQVRVISESGIENHEHIRRLREAGFAGALVGESLLRQGDVALAVRKLVG
ncbi:MAG: indole-3-glycerol-phosphate synthase TrpC, partial [Spirochaetia bacterium]|nr:indole-3-glycerol-phosphate synthase TrpC [Spirochaetia bacterium]